VQFFNKIVDVKDAHALATYVHLLKKNKLVIPQRLYDKVFNDVKNIHVLAEKLSTNEVLPSELNTKEYRKKYAQSKLFERAYYAKENDSISFFKEVHLKIKEEYVTVYFFKLKKVTQYNTTTTLHYIALKNSLKRL